MFPGRVQTQLTPPAQFVETDRGKGSDERKARCKGKEKRNDIESESRAAERNANDWIDQAKEYDVRGHRPEVFDALRQGIPKIHGPDRTDRRKFARWLCR